MIAFQHIKSGQFLRSAGDFSHVPMLVEAYPWHESDEAKLRARYAPLSAYRTVTYSTRIDHPSNNLAALTSAELAERYPLANAEGRT